MALTNAKEGVVSAPSSASLARAELIDKATRTRIEEAIDEALKRRPPSEAKLAGVARALAKYSPTLRSALFETTTTLVSRRSFDRDLYGASVRALAESRDRRTPALLASALACPESGPSTLAAACFCDDPALKLPLARAVSAGPSHVAFGAEFARVLRGESNGAHLLSLAPRIKESHRVALCTDIGLPLLRAPSLPALLGPALAVLRGAERHLGRWLVLGEIAARAGDDTPVREAWSRTSGSGSAGKNAWLLVHWAVSSALPGEALKEPPPARPTLELIARLSDRPSADKDMAFLFRMAGARAPLARPTLDVLAKGLEEENETALRAAGVLLKEYGAEEFRAQLDAVATTGRHEEMKGLAAALLWDAGAAVRAREIADDLVVSKSISNVGWGALIRVAWGMKERWRGPLVAESTLRWVQSGRLE